MKNIVLSVDKCSLTLVINHEALKSIPFLLAGLIHGSDKLYEIRHAIPVTMVTATLQHTNQPKL